MLSIPQDVIACIIDEIPTQLFSHRDRETLRACSIVSRSFLHPSQKTLFSSILLRHYSSDPDGYGSHLCRRFHNILASSPHISRYVRHLAIVDFKGRQSTSPEEHESWMLSEPTFPLVLRMLPCLRSFHVNPAYRPLPLNWHTFSADLKSSFIHLLRTPSLTTVEFRTLNVPSAIFLYAPQLTHLRFSCSSLDRSPNIQQLSLQYPQWPSPVADMKLTSLAIAAGGTWTVETLRSVFDIPQLRQLTVIGIDAHMLMVAAYIIKQASGSLESLQLMLHDVEGYRLYFLVYFDTSHAYYFGRHIGVHGTTKPS
jgi:hypothetical protein